MQLGNQLMIQLSLKIENSEIRKLLKLY